MRKPVFIIRILFFAIFFSLCSSLYSQTSIFNSQVPVNSGSDGDYELGLKFSSSTMAQISGIRFYKMPGEGSSHTATLWSADGNIIASAAFSAETSSGWQYATLLTPVLISANTIYIASVGISSVYAIEQHQLDAPVANGFLTTLAGGGVFNETPGQFPSGSYNNSNYFVDVVAAAANSIFTTQIPAAEFTDGPYEMGVKFTTSQAAMVKMISYYKTPGESGSHTGHLWSSSGALLASASFTNETTSGWQYAELTSANYIEPGNIYIVSVNSNTAYGAGTAQSLASPVSNGILSTVADGNNGVFSGTPNTQGVFPTFSYNNNNYFRDLIVEPVSPPALPSLISPAANENNVSIEPVLNWTSITGSAYSLQVAADSSFNSLIVNLSGLTSTSYNLVNLDNNKNYFWRVSAENEILSSGFSTPSKFTTVQNSEVLLSWPIGGTDLFTSQVPFSWYVESGGTGWKYDLLYSTDLNMTSPVIVTNINTNSYNLSGLQPGTKYYWKIRLKKSNGAVVSYSAKDDFVTFGKAVVPVPSSPINNVTVYNLSPGLYWYLNDASTGLTYEIEIREGTPAALTGMPTATNILQQFLNTSQLRSGTQYSWHVRSKSGTQYSDWSIPATFYTIAASGPIIPVPSWPVGNPMVYTISPTLNWYLEAPSTGLTFEIEYLEGSAAEYSGTPNVTNISALSATLSNLTPGKTYKWRVRSFNGDSYSGWSMSESFTIVSTVINNPVVPTPSWPISGAIVYASTVQLNWFIGTYRTGLNYQIELRTGTLNGTPTITEVAELYKTVNGLIPGATYFWRVRSTDGITTSGWSSTESFVTTSGTAAATTPILSWPVGGATVYTNSPTLSWFLNSPSGGITYELQYGTNANMSSSNVLSGLTSNQFTLNGLAPGTIYYWRVRSTDGIIYSPYSLTESFVTAAVNNSLVVPVAASPAQGISLGSSSAFLSWYLPTSGNISGYELQYSSDESMQNAPVLDLKSNSYLINHLEGNQTYYWRVRSTNSEGTVSEFSNLETFNPASLTGISKENEIPTSFQLMQNFPNPFNPTTVLRYTIPEEGFYSLDVFNILGEKVSSLVSNFLTPGEYSATFDGTNFSSGVYFYKLSGNNVNIVRKMILIK